jgi:hypothetical protein
MGTRIETEPRPILTTAGGRSRYHQGHRQSRVVVITSFLDRWSDAEEVEDLV